MERITQDTPASPSPETPAAPEASAEALADMEGLEWIERRAVQSLWCSASRPVRESLGLRVFERGALLGTFAPRMDVLAFNRVLGLGLPPDSYAALDAALDMGRRSGAARVFLPVAPGPVGWRAGARLEDQGLPVHNHWVRLSLRLDTPFHAGYSGSREGRPEVRPLGRPDAPAYGALIAEAFGLPAAAGPWLAGTVGWPGFIHYGVFRQGELAGVGALYIEGSAAWLAYGAVKPAFRGKGLHAALLGERLKAAREAGAAWITAETADWSGGRPSPSMRNLLRFGFESRYRRPNRIFIPGPGIGALCV